MWLRDLGFYGQVKFGRGLKHFVQAELRITGENRCHVGQAALKWYRSHFWCCQEKRQSSAGGLTSAPFCPTGSISWFSTPRSSTMCWGSGTVRWRTASSWRRWVGPACLATCTALSTLSSFSSTRISSQASRASLCSSQVGCKWFPQHCPNLALLTSDFRSVCKHWSWANGIVWDTRAGTMQSASCSAPPPLGVVSANREEFLYLSLKCRWILCSPLLQSPSRWWTWQRDVEQYIVEYTRRNYRYFPPHFPQVTQRPRYGGSFPQALWEQLVRGLWKPSLFKNPSDWIPWDADHKKLCWL